MQVVNPNPQEYLYRHLLQFPFRCFSTSAAAQRSLAPGPPNGDMRRCADHEGDAGRGREAARHGFRIWNSSRKHTDGSEVSRTHPQHALDVNPSRQRPDARTDPRRGGDRDEMQTHHLLLAHGSEPSTRIRSRSIQEIMNFLLLGGHIGRQGAGPCPIRGHSNVQGDRTMGFGAAMKRTRYGEARGGRVFFSASDQAGTDSGRTIKAMREGKIRFLPRARRELSLRHARQESPAKALQNCRCHRACFTQAQSLSSYHRARSRSSCRASAVLKSIARETGDQFITVEDSMGVIKSTSRGHLPPASETSAERTGDQIGRLPRRARRRYDGRFGKVSWWRTTTASAITSGTSSMASRVSTNGFARTSLYLPNEARDRRNLITASAKRNSVISRSSRMIFSRAKYLMMTVRSHDQFTPPSTPERSLPVAFTTVAALCS